MFYEQCRRVGSLLVALMAFALVAAACGDAVPLTAASDSNDAQADASASSVGAMAADSEFGQILVGPNGLTLYGFTNDTAAASTCTGTCAEAWPPVIVGSDWTVAADLDAGIFATTTRDDGQLQLVAGKWPLYYYIEDVAPGDVTGQLSGDVWFVVGVDGRLILDAATGGDVAAPDDGAVDDAAADDAPADDATATQDAVQRPTAPVDGPFSLSLAQTDVGTILVDPNGLSLYGFTDDADGNPTCVDECADAWPPVLVTALPENLNAARFSVAERPDGQLQLKSGKWPLYYFAGDAAPGDINGQGSGGTWFLVDVDSDLVQGAPSADATTDQTEGGTEADAEADDSYDS